MSSVRMCDNCRSIFSENDSGWQRGTVRNLATIGGETVVQIQSEDRCPACAVGAVAQGNAVRIYEPTLPKSLRGVDPRIQSALGDIAALPAAAREAVATVARAMGAVEYSDPVAEPTPVLPDGVTPVPPRSLPGTVGPVVPALEGEVVE
jgi:hypothetical protein